VTSTSREALTILQCAAGGHPGASSGERAAREILRNFQEGCAVDFSDAFVRLDGSGKRAVILLLMDLATGKTGLIELH
jgi:hypothetical protein